MKDATLKQNEVLNYIRDFIKENSYSPTVREIGSNFSISVKGAADHIQALKRKGYIDFQNKKSRTIRILKRRPADVVKSSVR